MGRDVLSWCESSGTSGFKKYFPLTPAYFQEFQTITGPQTHFLATKFPRFLENPFLFFVATRPTETSPTGLEVGFISYSNYRRIPKMLARHYGFPLEVFRDGETFRAWGPVYALAQDLSAIAAIVPAMIDQLGQRISENIGDYWPYLEGKKPLPEGLPPVQVSAKRLRHLKKHLAGVKPGDLFDFRAVWPGLQFVTCWKSSTCEMQLPRLRRWIGELPIVEGAYCATEGWMTVPVDRAENGTVLHPGAHIVEFLPVDQPAKKENLVAAWNLEPGRKYEVILTTSMGFVRYRLYDIVRCKGFFHRSPILEFVGKSGSMVSIGQVRFSEENLLRALREAGFAPKGRWIFGVDREARALVLYSDTAENGAPARLLEVQKHLVATNPDYQEDMDAGLMDPLRLELLPPDHPFWPKDFHAQTKPKVLSEAAP